MSEYAPEFRALIDRCDALEQRVGQMRIDYPEDHHFLMAFSAEAESLERAAHQLDSGHDDCSVWLFVHGRLDEILLAAGSRPIPLRPQRSTRQMHVLLGSGLGGLPPLCA